MCCHIYVYLETLMNNGVPILCTRDDGRTDERKGKMYVLVFFVSYQYDNNNNNRYHTAAIYVTAGVFNCNISFRSDESNSRIYREKLSFQTVIVEIPTWNTIAAAAVIFGLAPKHVPTKSFLIFYYDDTV